MTGRHAAPRDEQFDQLERETAGAHRADVAVPLVPEGAAAAPAKKVTPAKKPAARAKKTTPSTSKKAGTS